MKAAIYILLLIAFWVSANKPWKNPTEDTSQKWDDVERLEDSAYKNRMEIYRLSGSFDLLRKMKNKLSNATYTNQTKVLIDRVAKYVGCSVTEAEANEILIFFTTHQKLTFADQAKAVFSIGNIFLGLGVFLLSLATIALVICYCGDAIRQMNAESHIFTLYALAIGLLVFAYYKAKYTRSFVACLGAIILGLAYVYQLATLRLPRDDSYSIFVIPPIFAWGFLAIIFDSQVIGFITVLALGGCLIFTEANKELRRSLNGDEIVVLVAPSAILLAVYSFYGLGIFDTLEPYTAPFVISLFLAGGLVYFVVLLFLSSKFSRFQKYSGANMMVILSLLFIVLLGFASSGLAVYRTLAFFATVAYLALKFIEIPWGNCWGGGLLGGGALLFGVGMCLQAYWRFLFPETSHNF